MAEQWHCHPADADPRPPGAHPHSENRPRRARWFWWTGQINYLENEWSH